MKHFKTSVVNILGVPCLLTGIAAWLSAASVLTAQVQAADKTCEMNIGGYLSVGHSQAPASFNAGYSIYTAAWPLVSIIFIQTVPNAPIALIRSWEINRCKAFGWGTA